MKLKQVDAFTQSVWNFFLYVGICVSIALIMSLTSCATYNPDHRHAYRYPDNCELSDAQRAKQQEQAKAECRHERKHRGSKPHIVHYKCNP